MNPIEQRVAAGMSAIAAFLTEATCGEACWQAVEEVCRCSCGGKNHGCMRTADGVRPQRTAKIDGYRYTLQAVGTDLYDAAVAINKAAGFKAIDKISDTLTYHYSWSETDKGAPARLKSASQKQIDTWPELASAREAIAAVKASTHCYNDVINVWPSLLWVKV